MSQPEFKPANKLEEVLVAAAADPSVRPEFYRQLLDSELFLLTPEAPEQDGRRTLQEDAKISFVNLQNEKGPFLPIFTSQQRLQETVDRIAQTYGFIALKGRDLFTILAQHPPVAVLNPGAAYGKELTADEICRIANGSTLKTEAKVVQKATQVLLAQPAQYPKELVEGLRKLFVNHPTVHAAYLAQMHEPSGGEKPHLIIGIEASGDYQKIVGEAGMVSQDILGKDDFADFIQVGNGRGSLDSYFKTQTKPFYQVAGEKIW